MVRYPGTDEIVSITNPPVLTYIIYYVDSNSHGGEKEKDFPLLARPRCFWNTFRTLFRMLRRGVVRLTWTERMQPVISNASPSKAAGSDGITLGL